MKDCGENIVMPPYLKKVLVLFLSHACRNECEQLRWSLPLHRDTIAPVAGCCRVLQGVAEQLHWSLPLHCDTIAPAAGCCRVL